MIYTRLHLSSTDVTPPSACKYTEKVWLKVSSNILLFGMYVPPSLSTSVLDAIKDDIVENVDKLLEKQPNSKIIFAVELNQLSTDSLERDLCLKNLVDIPTRCSATLDKVLVDQDLIEPT